MIFAIGDIHAMYDPLRVLTDYIYSFHQETGLPCKIVFLGDYIDCGPSSKQVVDHIISLRNDFETITLMGNHEEMLLSFYNKTFNYLKVGSYWLGYNGGVQTVASFYPQSILFSKDKNPDAKAISELLYYDDILKLTQEYEQFFNSLAGSHLVRLESSERQYELLFSHSVPSPRYNLDEQISVKDWNGLQQFINDSGCDLEETHIWNRQLLNQQLRQDLTVVHGHTPTRYYRQMTKLLRFWEEEDGAPYVVREKKSRKLAQIDIDNGLVYGGSLTMLAIDDSPDAENIFPFYISVDPKRGFRHKLYKRQELNLL